MDVVTRGAMDAVANFPEIKEARLKLTDSAGETFEIELSVLDPGDRAKVIAAFLRRLHRDL